MTLRRRLFLLLAVGVLLTLAQVAMVHVASGNRDWRDTYRHSLCQWDCAWYASIVKHGYVSTVPPVAQDWDRSNVTFFPAFPVLGGAVRAATGWPATLALPIAAQLSTVAFWTLLLLLLTSLETNGGVLGGRLRVGLSVLTVMAHPASTFMVFGYAESLFMLAIVGLVYATYQRGRGAWLWAGASGFILTATRLAGLPLAALPVMQAMFDGSKAAWRRSAATMAMTVAGAGTFFAYCAWRWHAWDLYFRTEHVGWGVTPSYTAFFRPSNWVWSTDQDRWMPIVVLVALVVLAALEMVRPAPGVARRAPLLAAALLMLYLVIAGLSSRASAAGVARYMLPIWVVGLVAVNDRVARASVPRWVALSVASVVVVTSAFVCTRYTMPTAERYTHAVWAE